MISSKVYTPHLRNPLTSIIMQQASVRGCEGIFRVLDGVVMDSGRFPLAGIRLSLP